MIKKIKAKVILDSRKRPTVEVEVTTEKGTFMASCPSGASTGKTEAVVLPARKAMANVNKVIAKKLIGLDEVNQKKIDKMLIRLDGTKNKKKLGANAILPVSVAVCRAGAKAKKVPLYKYVNGRLREMPKPCFNIINGGAHAKNKLDVQEFMIIPQYKLFKDNFRIGKLIYKKLGRILKKELKLKKIQIGDEGGYSPAKLSNIHQALDYILQASKGYKVKIGLDVAATQLKEQYDLDFYEKLTKRYPIAFLEDPFEETDKKNFKKITKQLGKKIIIVGDDFLTTNAKRIKKSRKACNGIIIKPNQIGTVTETIKAVDLARKYKWETVVSHRSGETMDSFIADLAVAINSDFIKSGAPGPKERLIKYERLLKIEKAIA